jgi:hypothetical protein
MFAFSAAFSAASAPPARRRFAFTRIISSRTAKGFTT